MLKEVIEQAEQYGDGQKTAMTSDGEYFHIRVKKRKTKCWEDYEKWGVPYIDEDAKEYRDNAFLPWKE